MVIVVDVVEVQEPLKPAEWTENVPEVEFGAEGEAPDGDPSRHRAVDRAPGEGARRGRRRRGAGRRQRHRCSTRAPAGTPARCSTRATAATPRPFTTDGVIQGFGAALVGQKVGTKLIVTIPPEYAYGTDPAAHELGGQTLVFLVEIEGTRAARRGHRARRRSLRDEGSRTRRSAGWQDCPACRRTCGAGSIAARRFGAGRSVRDAGQHATT